MNLGIGLAITQNQKASVAPFTPSSLPGLVATVDVGVARAANLIWKDAGKTMLATADGDTVRAIDCPYTGKHWTTPGAAFTLKNTGGQWVLRTSGDAWLELIASIDLTNAFAHTRYAITSRPSAATFIHSSTVTGGNYYGFLNISSALAGGPFDSLVIDRPTTESKQGEGLGVFYDVACSMNESSSYLDCDGVRVLNCVNVNAVVAGFTLAGISGFNLYSSHGDFSFFAISAGQPSAANKSGLISYTRGLAGGNAPTSLIVAHGNSIVKGYGQNPGTSFPMVAGGPLGYANSVLHYGISGIQTPAMTSAIPTILALIAQSSLTFATKTVVILEGNNHLNAGSATALQAYAALVTCCQTWKDAGYRVILLDIIPADPASPSSLFTTRLAATNVLLKADFTVATSDPYCFKPGPGITHANVFVQLSAKTELSDPSNGTYFQTADKTHLTDAGALVVANAEVTAYGLLP